MRVWAVLCKNVIVVCKRCWFHFVGFLWWWNDDMRLVHLHKSISWCLVSISTRTSPTFTKNKEAHSIECKGSSFFSLSVWALGIQQILQSYWLKERKELSVGSDLRHSFFPILYRSRGWWITWIYYRDMCIPWNPYFYLHYLNQGCLEPLCQLLKGFFPVIVIIGNHTLWQEDESYNTKGEKSPISNSMMN